MNYFSPGSPRTIFDWAAIRDEFREKLDLLPIESLAIMYGLSCTEGYRDDEFVRVADAYLAKITDPVRTRFDFAYALGSWFWEEYSTWGGADLTKPPTDRPYETVKHEYNGPDFYRIFYLPEEPGYVGNLLEELRDKVMGWLLEGLSTYPDEQEVIDYAFYIVSRIGIWDTFLNEEDIPLMEAAAKKEISFKTSAGGRRILGLVIEEFEKHSGKEEKKNNQQFDGDIP